MRAAIFYTPAADDPLFLAAARWLGRNPATGEIAPAVAMGGLEADELHDLTASPRRYGFHATLKAPFRLADDMALSDLEQALTAYCDRQPIIDLDGLGVTRIGPFFALTPVVRSEPLDRLAADIVRAFERYRAPLNDRELERRNPERLSPNQRVLLARWGYPYVMEEFRFHMTLTGPVPEDRAAAMGDLLVDVFGPLTGAPVAIDALALYVEDEPGADFRIARRFPLRAPA